MNPLRFLIRILLIGGTFPLVSNASLTWENSQLQLTAMAGIAEIATAFSFRNTGTTPVTISDLRTSCSCTTAEMDKPHYAPGESGRIKVRFHPGERTGLVERTISVTTADQSTITMSLRVNLFEPVSCSAKTLTWTRDISPAEQSVEITANPLSPIHTISFEKDDLRYFTSIRVDTVKPTRCYRLSIIPLDTRKIQEIPVHCRLEFTDGSIRHLTIKTSVK